MRAMPSARSEHQPPCLCHFQGGEQACIYHTLYRLKPGEALYMVAGEPARFGRPWKRTEAR